MIHYKLSNIVKSLLHNINAVFHYISDSWIGVGFVSSLSPDASDTLSTSAATWPVMPTLVLPFIRSLGPVNLSIDSGKLSGELVRRSDGSGLVVNLCLTWPGTWSSEPFNRLLVGSVKGLAGLRTSFRSPSSRSDSLLSELKKKFSYAIVTDVAGSDGSNF